MEKILDPLDLILALTTQSPTAEARIFEVDPLLFAACGSEMKIVSVITEHNVIDAILRHLARTGRRDPFEGRAPPAP